MEEKTVCNRENKSQSDLWNRKCWIADSLASLIQSHVEYLAEKYAPELNADTDPGSPLWKLTKELDYYCEELRVRNGLRQAARSEQAGGRGVVELEGEGMNKDNGRERRDAMHKIHCNINARQTEIRKENKDAWEHWLYETYRLNDEIRGVASKFKRLREGTLPTTMRYCSHSTSEALPPQKLTCALGVNAAECPILKDVFVGIETSSPELLDELKANICVGHIFRETVQPGRIVDTSEGYILDESDRAYWDKTYAYLGMKEEEPE